MTARLRWLAASAGLMSALCLLGGCYESDVELLAQGDSADIAGRHACELLIGDRGPFELVIAAVDGGAYRFIGPDVTGTVRLKKLQGGRYLLQLSDDEKAGTWYYAYGEPSGDGGIHALYPKRENTALSAAVMQKYAIRFLDVMDREAPTGSAIKGNPEYLRQFLADPAAHELDPWFTCKKS